MNYICEFRAIIHMWSNNNNQIDFKIVDSQTWNTDFIFRTLEEYEKFQKNPHSIGNVVFSEDKNTTCYNTKTIETLKTGNDIVKSKKPFKDILKFKIDTNSEIFYEILGSLYEILSNDFIGTTTEYKIENLKIQKISEEDVNTHIKG